MSHEIITVFGGSTPRPGDPAYLSAQVIGGDLARAGYAVATGGYMGTMEAVSRGAAESGGVVIGVTSDQIEAWRHAGPNRWVQKEIRVPTVRERLFRLIDLASGLIALPGGIGTLAEVSVSWSLLQTGEVPPRPLILVGDLWQLTMATFLESAEGYVPQKDRRLLTLANDETSAVEQLMRMLRKPGGEHRSEHEQ